MCVVKEEIGDKARTEQEKKISPIRYQLDFVRKCGMPIPEI